jgi:hypothetical protein
VQLASLPGGGWPKAVVDADCDVLVISKSFHAENEALARAMKGRGKRVVVDICDDHFAHPEFGRHLRALVELADGVIAATPAMADSIRRNTGRDAAVVTDPVEGPRGEPRFAPKFPELEIVWFGHPSNAGGVVEKAAELGALAERYPLHLSMVTAQWPQLPELLASLNAIDPGRLRVDAVAWSTDATWQALESADLAWIPVAAAGEKAMKSPNRLLESLWAGRLVVADEVPSYLPFADVTPVGVPLADAMRSALAGPAAVEAKIAEAQRRIAAAHSPYECAVRGRGHSATRPSGPSGSTSAAATRSCPAT